MLVLTRRHGESVRIGVVTLKFDEIRGQQVIVSINAPPSIAIIRTELAQEKQDYLWARAMEAQRAAE